MYIEQWRTQEIRETSDGIEFRRLFKVDRVDWNNGTFPYRIGQALWWDGIFPFTTVTDSLVITQINSVPTQNPAVLESELMYSNQTGNKAYERPDQVASWEVSGSASLIEEKLGTWVDQNGFKKNFQDEWAAQDGVEESDEGELDPPAPDLYVTNSSHQFNITLYGSGLYIHRLQSALGHTNLNEHFQRDLLMTTDTEGETDSDITSSLYDKYQWKFSDMRYSKVRRNCWRFDLTFERWRESHRGTTYHWNAPFGDSVKEGTTVMDLNYYPESDLLYLISGMNKIDDFDNPSTEIT